MRDVRLPPAFPRFRICRKELRRHRRPLHERVYYKLSYHIYSAGRTSRQDPHRSVASGLDRGTSTQRTGSNNGHSRALGFLPEALASTDAWSTGALYSSTDRGTGRGRRITSTTRKFTPHSSGESLSRTSVQSHETLFRTPCPILSSPSFPTPTTPHA